MLSTGPLLAEAMPELYHDSSRTLGVSTGAGPVKLMVPPVTLSLALPKEPRGFAVISTVAPVGTLSVEAASKTLLGLLTKSLPAVSVRVAAVPERPSATLVA